MRTKLSKQRYWLACTVAQLALLATLARAEEPAVYLDPDEPVGQSDAPLEPPVPASEDTTADDVPSLDDEQPLDDPLTSEEEAMDPSVPADHDAGYEQPDQQSSRQATAEPNWEDPAFDDAKADRGAAAAEDLVPYRIVRAYDASDPEVPEVEPWRPIEEMVAVDGREPPPVAETPKRRWWDLRAASVARAPKSQHASSTQASSTAAVRRATFWTPLSQLTSPIRPVAHQTKPEAPDSAKEIPPEPTSGVRSWYAASVVASPPEPTPPEPTTTDTGSLELPAREGSNADTGFQETSVREQRTLPEVIAPILVPTAEPVAAAPMKATMATSLAAPVTARVAAPVTAHGTAPVAASRSSSPKGRNPPVQRMKERMRRSHWGYPQYFEEQPLGFSIRTSLDRQIEHGRAARLMLHHMDFHPEGTERAGQLTVHGQARVRRLSEKCLQRGMPLGIELVNDSEGINKTRRESVLAFSETAGLGLTPDMIVTRSEPHRIEATEAVIIQNNLLKQTLSGGGLSDTTGSGSGSSLGLGSGSNSGGSSPSGN
jgi:hypothetical protein